MSTSATDLGTAGILGLFNSPTDGTMGTNGTDLGGFLNSDMAQMLMEWIEPYIPQIESLISQLTGRDIDLREMFAGAATGIDPNAAAASPDARNSYERSVERIEGGEEPEAVVDANFTHVSAAELYEYTAEADIVNGETNLEAGMEITLDSTGQTYTLVSHLDDESGVRAYTLQDEDGNMFTTVPGVDLPENIADLQAELEQGGNLTSMFMRGAGEEFINDRDDMLAERGGLLTPGEGGISEQRVALAEYIAEVEAAHPDASHTMIGHSFGASLIASIPGTSGYLFAPAGVNQTVAGDIDGINDRFEVISGAADPAAEILGRPLEVDTTIDTSDVAPDRQIAGHITPGAVLGLNS
ncbi:MAG: hypothetical protein AAF569_01290 [Pseudomonadota bacterium]